MVSWAGDSLARQATFLNITMPMEANEGTYVDHQSARRFSQREHSQGPCSESEHRLNYGESALGHCPSHIDDISVISRLQKALAFGLQGVVRTQWPSVTPGTSEWIHYLLFTVWLPVAFVFTRLHSLASGSSLEFDFALPDLICSASCNNIIVDSNLELNLNTTTASSHLTLW